MTARTPRLHQISTSHGGVPKLPVLCAEITRGGVSGDRQNDARHHGGPDRAVCLFSLELIERLRAEGHPVAPGACGENLTVSGLDWPEVVPGARLRIGERGGGVELEITAYTTPCSAIRGSFKDLDSTRIKQELHPGESRVYARVLREGTVRPGDLVLLIGAHEHPANQALRNPNTSAVESPPE